MPLPGDPENGKAIFYGKARCAECHMVTGKGGVRASDLSDFGRSHSFNEIRSAIVKPIPSLEIRNVVVTMQNGTKLAARVRNEDNFSLQLQTADGAFHFLDRADVVSMEPDTNMVMPADYGSTLTQRELNDVISYLLRSNKGHEATSEGESDE